MDMAEAFNKNRVGFSLPQKQPLIKGMGTEMDNALYELTNSDPTAILLMVNHMQKQINTLESRERETDSAVVGLLNHVGPHNKDTGPASL